MVHFGRRGGPYRTGDPSVEDPESMQEDINQIVREELDKEQKGS